MTRAQQGLESARQAHAADYAPVDLDFAQARFNQAQTAMNTRKYVLAADLAAQSLADSQVAVAKSQLATLRAQIQAKTRENARLRTQLPAPPAQAVPDTRLLPEQVLPMPADTDPDQAWPATPAYDTQGEQP